MSNVFSAKLHILQNRNRQNCVKTTNQNSVPETEIRRRACFADKHGTADRREGFHRRGR